MNFRPVLLSALVVSGAFSALAQTEAETSAKEALDAIKAKKWATAGTALQTALMEVNNQIAEEFKLALPKPAAGWTEESSDGIQTGLGILGGGSGAEKTYQLIQNQTDESYTETPSVKISILANSPMVSTISMAISNPMMMGAMGKSVKVGSEKGIEKAEPENKSYEITLLVGGNVLVTISGTGITDRKVVLDYAQAIDFKKIKAVMAE